ncbi:TniQ family protein [Pseudomonas sp. EA_65y_Pfl2_P78]|uniref:TniQ family protein n=1 Tax=Pseudomonas sp. EA_65y_Pfl2_P78 TaxID=3088695 RepID=UPI0030D88923
MPDELFSSWLARVALAHGYSPTSLAAVVWPTLRIWTQDFDRGGELSRLEKISAYVGIPATQLQLSTLRQAAQLLLGGHTEQPGVWPWLLVLGCRNKFHAGGLQCCPECFSHGNPYYRIQWRLAWHTCCEIHEISLIDCCYQCGAPLQPGLLKAGNLLRQCHACGSELAACARTAPLSGALAIQKYADQMIGSSGLFGDVALDFTQWMRIARAMVSLLQVAARQRSKSILQLCECLGVDAVSLTPALLVLPLEYLAQPERARLLAGAWAMMVAGPDRFMSEACRATLPVSALHVPAHGAPDILMRMAGALKIHSPHRPIQRDMDHPRAQLEVLRMWLRLTRRMKRNGL